MSNLTLAERDLQYIWHPCSQMKDYESFKPLTVVAAQGSYIELANGKKIIDAISSWWCKSLGHGHPRIKQAVFKQINNFEHVIFANTTNETIVHLSETLAKLTKTLNKIFYAGDGSCAVEIAMKMSIHSRHIRGNNPRNHFIALSNGYHGETVGALSASDLGIYRDAYRALLFPVSLISSIPYVSGKNDPGWLDSSSIWPTIEKQLAPLADKTTAIILEPIVQGAGGMQIYSPDFLQRLYSWTRQHDVHLIADEIMTGIGRTGKMLACEYANIEPDFLCLSKGLTSGWFPFSAVLTTNDIYSSFYDDYSTGKSFLHSHTYSGHVLGAAAAVETLAIMADEKICDYVQQMESILYTNMAAIAAETGKLKNIRGIGALIAADLVVDDSKRRFGFEIYQRAVELGALLRPIGNTIYWFPPLNTSKATLNELKDITQRAICSVLNANLTSDVTYTAKYPHDDNKPLRFGYQCD